MEEMTLAVVDTDLDLAAEDLALLSMTEEEIEAHAMMEVA